jgi:hypothetical protein
MMIQLFLKNNLAIHFYFSEDSINNEIVNTKDLYIIFQGLPQSIEKDFFKDKVKKERAFMVIYYYGSYYSGKNFTFLNCQKSVQDAIKFAIGGQGVKTYDNEIIKWRVKNISIIGNSFAGNPILTCDINKNEIKKVVLISPLIFVHKEDLKKVYLNDQIQKIKKYNKDFLGFMTRGYKNIYKGINDKTWLSYFNGDNNKSKISINSNFPPIIIYHGKEDFAVSCESSILFKKLFKKDTIVHVENGVGHDFKKLFNI